MKSTRVGLATILIFFGGLGTWAALAPLDGAVAGSGVLAVHGNRKTLQHREGGIVAALLSADGDHVQAGQILIRLDATQALATLHIHEAQVLGDEALMARTNAELADLPQVTFPATLQMMDPIARSVVTREQNIFVNQRALMRQQLAIIDQRIAQAQDQEIGARHQLEAALQGVSLATMELRAFTTLERTGLASRTRVLELARTVETLQGDVGQLQSDVARHRAEAAELSAEKLRLRVAADSEATHESREAQLRLNDVFPRLAADHDILSRLDIRAPVSGEILNQQVFTKGGIIEAGRPILDIVPSASEIVADVEIRPEDIDSLHVGQAARIIMTGFNPRRTPAIQGRIRTISADRIVDPRSGRAFYKAEIGLVEDDKSRALLHRLNSGMPVEAVVDVRPRTALEYLIEPLHGSLQQAGHEL